MGYNFLQGHDVDISFKTTKMAKTCINSKERVIAYGPERAKKIGLRLDQMRAAANLRVFKAVHPRCHPLSADRESQWSADLDGPYRLLFEIADDPVPLDPHGNIDLAEVQKVRIIQIADTHAT
jgi:plasmid maintenance system killer protein